MGNKSYRIRTDVGKDKFLHVQLDQDYDVLEILSLKIGQQQFYRLHTSNYGVIVGRVLANGGFGVPNAKVSLFISKDNNADVISTFLYPYGQVTSTNEDGIRYNLLPSEKVTDCHNPVGTFPSKQYMLDNDSVLDVFEDYYRYTTKTNDAGDYMFVGVPVGSQTLHMDLDLSDCGVLSQRPYDFLYKGYNIEQFENANQFKTSNTLEELSQIFTQDQTVEVKPFWGDSSDDLQDIGITRADINVNFKFETSCVFLGSVFSDDADNGMSKRCLPRKKMGKMENLRTGEGTIEIIRKRTSYVEDVESSIEELQIKGTQLIDGDGTWCFQIPMNLDYMITDEYGNLVPTDNPEKGIATRARVRFRISMNSDDSSSKYFQAKVLVPNNPKTLEDYQQTYIFGSNTQERDFKDLFWNNVYSVKSYIPRLQHANMLNNRSKRFTGIKTVNKSGSNNPFPYNHIRIQFPFYYTLICWLVNVVNAVVYVFNGFKTLWNHFLQQIYDIHIGKWHLFGFVKPLMFKSYTKVSGSFCPELSDRYFIPGAPVGNTDGHGGHQEVIDLYGNTFRDILQDEYPNLTGAANQFVPSGGDIWYPIQSGKTFYGYYRIHLTDDDDYTGILYLLGNIGKNALVDNKITKEDKADIYSQLYIGIATGDTVAGENLLNEKVFLFRNKWKSNIDIKQLKLGSYYSEDITYTDLKCTFSNKKFTLDASECPAFSASNYTQIENVNTEHLSELKKPTSELDFKKMQWHSPDGKDNGNYTTIYSFIENSVNSFLDNLFQYVGDKNSIAFQSLTTAKTADEQMICVHPKTDYLVSCIEYNLAEELEIINFDFYNDWINGAIYMPRWARVIRTRKINGKTTLRSCSDDANKFKWSLVLSEMSPIGYRTNHIATVEDNLSHTTWQQRARSKSISYRYLVHGENYITDKTTRVFYYIPSSFDDNGRREAILFATDIILLGSLSDCNRYGIPSEFDMYIGTTYQMPPDLATTNLTGDDGSGISFSEDGCLPAKDIKGKSNNKLWDDYNKSKEPKLEDNITSDFIPVTEEAGVSWNKLGPNQTPNNATIASPFLYSPGGHFLGLACSENRTQTNFKSNINLLRACELGVSLSERQVEPYYYNNGDIQNIYIAPTGLINNNDIYDNYGRALFATLNSNELSTVVDTENGYLKYDFQYLSPYGFAGEAQNIIARNNSGYNGQITVKYAQDVVDKDVDIETKWEKEHTFTRANDDISNDYLYYRLGRNINEWEYIGISNLQDKFTREITWSGRLNDFSNIFSDVKFMPVFKNSYYFYFGLHTNSTSIDKFRRNYQATCAKREIVTYKGYITSDTGYTDNNMDRIFAKVVINDIEGPYTITISEYSLDDNYGIFFTKPDTKNEFVIEKEILTNYTTIIGNMDFHKGDVYENFSGNTFYVQVDNDLKTYVTVTGSKGDVFTKVLGSGGLQLDTYYTESIPFSQQPRTYTLNRTGNIQYGVVTGITGGYFRTDFPINDMIHQENQFSNKTYELRFTPKGAQDSFSFGVNNENNSYIKVINSTITPIYDIPVKNSGDYDIDIIEHKVDGSQNVTRWKSDFNIPVDSTSDTVYLVNIFQEKAVLDNTKKLEEYTGKDLLYVLNNLVQYGKPYRSISLTTEIGNKARYDFIGQGEKYIPNDSIEDLDRTKQMYNPQINKDIIIPSRPNDDLKDFSLSETVSYIPTQPYSGRRIFNVAYYDTTHVYSQAIAEVTIKLSSQFSYKDGTLADGLWIQIHTNLTQSTITGLTIGDMVLLRGGNNDTGEEIFVTWAMVWAIQTQLITAMLTMDDIREHLNTPNMTIGIFKPYSLPIYYVNEKINQQLKIILSNKFSEFFYKKDGFTKVTISGWYDEDTVTFQKDDSKLGCEFLEQKLPLKVGLIAKNQSRAITDNTTLGNFNKLFFKNIIRSGTTIDFAENIRDTESLSISFGECMTGLGGELNSETKQTFNIGTQSHFMFAAPKWRYYLSDIEDTEYTTSPLVIDCTDVYNVEGRSYSLIDEYYAISTDKIKIYRYDYDEASNAYSYSIGNNGIMIQPLYLVFDFSDFVIPSSGKITLLLNYTGGTTASYTEHNFSDGTPITHSYSPRFWHYTNNSEFPTYEQFFKDAEGGWSRDRQQISVTLTNKMSYNKIMFCILIPFNAAQGQSGIQKNFDLCINDVMHNNLALTAHNSPDYWQGNNGDKIVVYEGSAKIALSVPNYYGDTLIYDSKCYRLNENDNNGASNNWCYITSN